MHITNVYVSGFKSLVEFSLDLSPFTCLVGLNGCGKSTVLQFFDFLSHVLGGDVEKWFEVRDWEPGDVISLPGAWDNIEFKVEFSDGSRWEGTYCIPSLKCTREHITTPTASIWLMDGKLRGHATGEEFPDGGPEDLDISTDPLSYHGSSTSLLRDETLPSSILALRRYFQRLRVFDTLSPQSLRKRDRGEHGSIGHNGEHLSTVFGKLSVENQTEIVNTLVDDFHKHLGNLSSQSRDGGWKELEIHELYGPAGFISRSKHINDGFLRVLAVLIELQCDRDFLLFDEIENGINPELVEKLVDKLSGHRHQVLVTTHSPMILNYLDDETARKGVVLLHKSGEGRTRAVRFFDIPSVRNKLDFMGPGEAYVDTDLVALSDELSAAGVE